MPWQQTPTPFGTHQIRHRPSKLLDAIRVPSTLKSTAVTGSEWAGTLLRHFPDRTSQTLIVSSKLPLACQGTRMSLEGAEKQQLITATGNSINSQTGTIDARVDQRHCVVLGLSAAEHSTAMGEKDTVNKGSTHTINSMPER
jgi:hypothetical protein